jgi:OOP family OmpA-OmpF porin
MKCTVLFILAALLAPAAGAEPGAEPVVVTGTVADEASKAAILGRLREVYGAARVVDQLSIGTVSAPANWNAHMAKLIGPSLKLVTRGQLMVDGNAVSLRGDVAGEAQRQQVAADIAAGLNPTYTVDNGLRVVESGQVVLDAALKDRIIEFESGKATLTESGRAILDEMSVALLKVKGRKVAVIGHTDNAGPRARNLSLSRARAAAVKAYVVGKGVDPGSIAVSGQGPDHPLSDNRTAAGKARNRRIEFKVM